MNFIEVEGLIKDLREKTGSKRGMGKEYALGLIQDGGTHTVTFDDCEGAAHPDSHRLSHFLYDKFAWFKKVAVKNRQNLFLIEIHHDYPEGIDIEEYTERWIHSHFGGDRARFSLEFHRS